MFSLIHRLRRAEVIYREEVILSSGQVSDFYCDIKKAYGCPGILNALAEEMGKLIPPGVNCVAAGGYGGLPLGVLVAARFGKKFIAIRGTPKKHGKGGWIDGYIPGEEDSVVILDDVLTTGSSIRKMMLALKPTEAKIYGAVVVVKRGESELPIPCQFLFEIKQLLT